MDDAALSRQRRMLLSRNKRARYERGESSSANVGMVAASPRRYEKDGSPELLDIGAPEYCCQKCGASFWYRERCKKNSKINNPKYSLCCRDGRVSLTILKEPPNFLHMLFDRNAGLQSVHFRDNIRMYNSMFAFTSMGVKVDEKINDGNGPYVFRVSGQTYHMIGSVLPVEGSVPMFAQLYMYDTANEIANRINAFTDSSKKKL